MKQARRRAGRGACRSGLTIYGGQLRRCGDLGAPDRRRRPGPAGSGHTYYLLASSFWDAAEAEAVSLGGHLVTVNDAAENQWLLDTFGPLALSLAGGKVSLLTGFNDAAAEGAYEWASGETPAYTNWVPGEPAGSHADEDYAAINVVGYGDPGQWHDIVSDGRYGDSPFGVVEVAAAPVPEPGTLALLGTGGLGLVGSAVRKRRKAAAAA